MYQLTVKGRTLDELKNAVADKHKELQKGVVAVKGLVKDMSEIPTSEKEVEKEEPKVITNNEEEESYEVDSERVPWDERIHASTKTTKSDGTWKLKRGVDKAYAEKIKKELTEAMDRVENPVEIPEAPAAPVVEDTPIATKEEIVEKVQSVPGAMEVNPNYPAAAPVVEAPKPAPIPVNTGGHSLETFTANFPMIIASLISEGKLTQEYINSLKDHFGVSEIWDTNEEQKKGMFETFAQYGLIQKVG